jgi:multicomponent Na+:H+ antiporter subunit E
VSRPVTAGARPGPSSWMSWPLRWLGFALWYLGALARSYADLIRDSLTSGENTTPGIVELDTRCDRDAELTFLGALISLTPGTLTMGAGRRVGPPGPATRVMWVHSMYNADAEDARGDLQEMERRMLHAVRRNGFRP